MSIEKKPNKIITRILLGIIGFILRSRSKVRLLRDDASNIKPPYIILGNHVNNWDPFFVNEFVDEPISFIAANSLFFNPILKALLNYIGIIPKSKEKRDIRAIRQILRAKRHERIIGIFPEGNVTWDGSYEKIDDSTAKLIKLLKIPV
ncbi:MAG: 1-acyl-sn-glycerol-3-phosphate acyltransferase, partial [Clostridiales bacterium]|nr:1-acyl-sn-glycerol-3-phosphate acyltransferase [Clostridiales bacterium]